MRGICFSRFRREASADDFAGLSLFATLMTLHITAYVASDYAQHEMRAFIDYGESYATKQLCRGTAIRDITPIYASQRPSAS